MRFTNLPEEELLIRTICENPQDDTARLVYADFIEENGGVIAKSRARYIRNSIKISHPAPDISNFGEVLLRDKIVKEVKSYEVLCNETLACFSCNGNNEEFECSVCKGTGNLLDYKKSIYDYWNRCDSSYIVNRVTYYNRGFINGIECTLHELGVYYEPTNTFVLGKWCSAILDELPITEFYIIDRLPDIRFGKYVWVCETYNNPVERSIPKWIHNRLERKAYKNSVEARQVLAKELGRICRHAKFSYTSANKIVNS